MVCPRVGATHGVFSLSVLLLARINQHYSPVRVIRINNAIDAFDVLKRKNIACTPLLLYCSTFINDADRSHDISLLCFR